VATASDTLPRRIPTATGGVVDCDVHHDWATPDVLLPYLSKGWREYVQGPSRSGTGSAIQTRTVPINPSLTWPSPAGIYRPESYPPGGGQPASDYELVRRQHLDPHRIERAVLTYGAGSFVAALPNPYFAAEVARAANDWCLDTWLDGRDDRLYGAILLANQLPDEAAAEIRRLAGHPRMVEALLVANGIGKPFGHPLFHPIFEAAAETGLPVAIHVGGEGLAGQVVAPTGSGNPSSYLEYVTLSPQGIMTHLVSLIVHGVFEKYPSLRVLLVECSTGWIPWLLWRLDNNYKALRRDAPWLRRRPSEYFRDHVRVTTQPLDSPEESDQLVELLGFIGGEDILCYSSDYPHWDADELPYVIGRLPKAWLPKVLRENAMELYGFADAPAGSTAAVAT